MRGATPLLGLLTTALLALAGCSSPPGTDGDLVDAWPTLPAAAFDVPAVGQCLTGDRLTAFEPADAPLSAVDCAEEHLVEVVAVGTFTDAAAAGAAPPWDSDPTRGAYAECDKAAQQYVGGDWRTGRLFPHLTLPRPAAWAGGARHHVCGLAEAADDFFTPLPRTGSLKAGLTGDRPLALSCVLLSGDLNAEGFYSTVKAVRPVACTEPHDTEFVGVYTAPAGAYPAPERLKSLANDACYARIAAYLGVTQNELYQRGDVYTFWTGLLVNQWKLGDRTAHCYLNVSSRKLLRASVKGLGTKPLPTA